jgi:hypothetical protein
MLGAAEAVPAAARLTAAIPAAPIAVFIVVVVNFTMGSFSCLISERELAIEARTRRVVIAERQLFQTQPDCVLVEFSPTSWANEELSIYSEAQFKQLLHQRYQWYWYRLRQIRNAGRAVIHPDLSPLRS